MTDLLEYQKIASQLLDVASDGDRGRSATDRFLVDKITEGRLRGRYSCCGDVAHWLYYRLGVREHWINRDEFRGWRMGLNISLLCRHRYAGEPIEAGDVLIIYNKGSNSTHAVCVAAAHDDGWLSTVEGGQPGCEAFLRRVAEKDGLPCLATEEGKPGRTLQWHLRLETVIATCQLAPADRSLVDGLIAERNHYETGDSTE